MLQLLKGRRIVTGLFEKKRDAIPPHPSPLQALLTTTHISIALRLIPSYNKSKSVKRYHPGTNGRHVLRLTSSPANFEEGTLRSWG
jgi:hypothetical protein